MTRSVRPERVDRPYVPAGRPVIAKGVAVLRQSRDARVWTSLFAAAALAWVVPVQAQTGPQFPQLTGRVVDAADILPPDAEARIDRKLAGLEAQSRRQLVVVTLPSLQGYEISDYGYQLGRNWGIGSKDGNDGALLIVAPNERKLRIEVGYGLEGVLTDGLSSLIVNQTIVPRFKQGDMAGGIEAGTDAIVRQLTLPDEEARQLAAQAAKPQVAESGFGFHTVIFVLFLLLFFVLPMLRGRKRGRRYGSGLGPVVVWPGSGGGWSGGGGFGGGGFGGGGFSGGGGSFGGGGSSGSW